MSDMINIQVTGADAIDKAIEELLHKAQNLDRPFHKVGNYLTNIMKESFDNEESPDGDVWEPLSEKTLDARWKKGTFRGKILQDSQTLRESTGYGVDDDSVFVGVNAYSGDRYPYPVVHQFGSKDGKTPERSFMPINKNGELYENVNEEVLDILLEYLA